MILYIANKSYGDDQRLYIDHHVVDNYNLYIL